MTYITIYGKHGSKELQEGKGGIISIIESENNTIKIIYEDKFNRKIEKYVGFQYFLVTTDE